MLKNIWEIFDQFQKASSKVDKINVLRQNKTHTLTAVLQGAFHPRIHYVIKEIPPYVVEDAPPGMGYSTLGQELSRIYLIVEGSKTVDPNLSLDRKRVLFIQMLESLEPKEAKVLENMVMKDLKVPGLTYSLVKEAFPGLLP